MEDAIKAIVQNSPVNVVNPIGGSQNDQPRGLVTIQTH
jgi:hypothetical protein